MVAARAPGKIILSGEHAVVYGAPALLAAVNRYMTVRIVPGTLKGLVLHQEGGASIHIPKPAARGRSIETRFSAFRQGLVPLTSVMRNPGDFVCCACYLMAEHTGVSLETVSLEISIESDIPRRSGMGSSAALACALVKAYSHFYGIDPQEALADWTTEIEHRQHSRSSGADPAACARGGMIRFEQGRCTSMETALSSMTLVHSGQPTSSTGECVQSVARQHFPVEVWTEFRTITEQMAVALGQQDQAALREVVRQNHRMLCTIGVVPQRTERFIRAVEEVGGAAKVCGAGAVKGTGAGMCWVLGGSELDAVLESFGFTRIDVEIDHDGTRLLV